MTNIQSRFTLSRDTKWELEDFIIHYSFDRLEELVKFGFQSINIKEFKIIGISSEVEEELKITFQHQKPEKVTTYSIKENGLYNVTEHLMIVAHCQNTGKNEAIEILLNYTTEEA